MRLTNQFASALENFKVHRISICQKKNAPISGGAGVPGTEVIHVDLLKGGHESCGGDRGSDGKTALIQCDNHSRWSDTDFNGEIAGRGRKSQSIANPVSGVEKF